MGLTSTWNMRASAAFSIPVPPTMKNLQHSPSRHTNFPSIPFRSYPFRSFPHKFFVVHAKKRNPQSEPVLKPSIVEEVSLDDDEENEVLDDFEDEEFMDDDEYIEDEDDAELYVGDGAGGGGVKLAGTLWDKEALAIAEDVCMSIDGELKVYAFRTLLNSTIQVRIETLSNKSGSPSMTDIESFSSTYRARLDAAVLAGSIPEDVSLEVSSPGVERVVRIPQDLDRFKDRPMYVKYVDEIADTSLSTESNGVFRLESYDMETQCCTWGIADVKINRAKAGKGRPLNKKQREWRLNTPFDSLRLVRLHSDI